MVIARDRERVWRIGTRVSLLVVAALVIVLAATGTWLAFRYRPHPSAATVPGVHADGMADTMHHVHLDAAYALLIALFVLAVFGVGLFASRGHQGWAVVPIGALLLGLGAQLTGAFLPWDQLALKAVRAGLNMRGFGPILHPRNVRYVLIGSDELSTPTVSHFFWLHAVVIPLLLVAAVVAITIGTRRRRRPAANELPVEPLEEFAHQ